MITDEGKKHIKRYLAGWNSTIAQAIAFGSGATAESSSDALLNLEIGRVQTSFVTYDFVNDVLVFKASLPDDFVGKVYEVGLYSLYNDPNEFPSRFISTFDSGTENWQTGGVDATFTAVATRIGADSLSHTPAASATATSVLAGTGLDLSGFSGSDGFTFAYNVADGNTNQIVFKFLTDASNYYSFSMGVQTAGYKIVQTTKGAATITGSPSWSNITEVDVSTTAKSGGATSVEFDAIRLEDKDSTNLDYVLVARKVLAVPQTKIAGQPMDIECSLDITI